METTMINHPRLRIGLRIGAEGPRHDPYHFEEYKINVPGVEVILHFGLGSWATVGKTSLALNGLTEEERVKFLRGDFLLKITGFTMPQLNRIMRKRGERCRCCSGRHFKEVAGYPGEHFLVCSYCGEVADTYFCVSEVI